MKDMHKQSTDLKDQIIELKDIRIEDLNGNWESKCVGRSITYDFDNGQLKIFGHDIANQTQSVKLHLFGEVLDLVGNPDIWEIVLLMDKLLILKFKTTPIKVRKDEFALFVRQPVK